MRNPFGVRAKIALLLLVPLMSTSTGAQEPCTQDMVMAKKVAWTHPPLSQLRHGEEALHLRAFQMGKLLEDAYEPRGTRPTWQPWVGSQVRGPTDPIAYSVDAEFILYSCSPRPPSVLGYGDETAVWAYVKANSLGWVWENGLPNMWTDPQHPTYLLTKRVGELHGYPVYEGIHNTKTNTGVTYSRAIILTRPGQSPFVPVTAREFLTSQVAYVERNRTEVLAAEGKRPVRPDAAQEADKQRYLAEIDKTARPNRRDEQRAKFLESYRTDQQRKDETLLKTSQRFDAQVRELRSEMAGLSEVDAEKPAFMDWGAKLMTEAQGGRMLVRKNPKYFNPALPDYAPQFLAVYWRWDDSRPGLDVKEQLEAKLDFKALQAMLDK